VSPARAPECGWGAREAVGADSLPPLQNKSGVLLPRPRCFWISVPRAGSPERVLGWGAREAPGVSTVRAHDKKHRASLPDTLGFLGFLGFEGCTMENVTFAHKKPMDILGVQGWVSFGRSLC